MSAHIPVWRLFSAASTDGVTTKYAYDAVGRLIREGNRTYRYGYLDKVLSVTEGERTYSYDYHVDGQLARADHGGNGAGCLVSGAGVETFEWDGLALIRRGDERFVNEPHIGGGNPVASSRGTTYFNDILGTTLGATSGKYGKYTAAALTAFGEDVSAPGTKHQAPSTFFTGKPEVAGLGYAFLFRNYRASLAKWQTADPLGYPDGWNQLAYCGNGVTSAMDVLGVSTVNVYDYAKKIIVSNIEQLTVGKKVNNQTGDQNGSCQLGYNYEKSSDYKLTMNIYIDININGIESARWDSGSIAEYFEHQGGEFDSKLTDIKEAIVMHELGHANYVLSTMKELIKIELDTLEQEW